MEQASELFMDLVCTGGTPSMDCQLCKRTHFATGPQSCESEEEIAELRRCAELRPDKFCEHSEDSLAVGMIDGRQCVWNCPCNGLRRYEDFIWDHRTLIVQYIKKRTAKDAADAKRVQDELSSIDESSI